MATSFPISLPTTGVRRIRLRQNSVVALGRSPYSLESQVQRHPGQQWLLDIEYPPMPRATAEALVAALCSLNGREGTFLFGDSANPALRGTGAGTPLVKGASQTGEDLITDGWNVGTTILPGDWIQLGTGSTSRLYKNLATATADGTGTATLTIWPRIVTAWADNAPLTIASPKGVFRLLTNGQDWDIALATIYGLSISAESVI